jgi:hypothetical protein
MSPQAQQIIAIVQQVATQHNAFLAAGPGAGNNVTNLVMEQSNQEIAAIFGEAVIEKAFLDGVKQNVDFYLEATKEVIEVEFSLSNPYPCLDKDSMKILLARDGGHEIDRLILVGDPGCRQRMSAAAPKAIMNYLRRVHGLTVEIHELT